LILNYVFKLRLIDVIAQLALVNGEGLAVELLVLVHGILYLDLFVLVEV